MATPYQIGYAFERRTMKFLQEKGYFTIRSGKSKFPDGIAVSRFGSEQLPSQLIWECKKNKYLSREEKDEAKRIIQITGLKFFVFWNDNRRLVWYEIEM